MMMQLKMQQEVEIDYFNWKGNMIVLFLALEYTPADGKSLYRRASAFERLGKLNEAISDAQRLMSVTGKGGSPDEQTYNLLRKLRENAQSKVFNKVVFCIPNKIFFFIKDFSTNTSN